MILPEVKIRGKVQYELVSTFHCKADTHAKLKMLKSQNAFFAPKIAFLFEVKLKRDSPLYGVYSEIIYAWNAFGK